MATHEADELIEWAFPHRAEDRHSRMRFLRNLVLSLHFLLAGASGIGVATADVITGRVVSVADGDTITILTSEKRQAKVRLAAIDAPENGQEFGRKSKDALAALVAGKTVTVTEDGTDRYGRMIGWVRAEDTDANREMVRTGWAWHFTQYNRDPGIARMQIEAKNARRGLWAAPNPPMSPWDYRALKRQGAAAERPASEKPTAATGQFWLNANGVRHNFGCRWFGNTAAGRYGPKSDGKACGICGG